MIIDFNTISTIQIQQWLQYAVAPRPIALASTMDENGLPNLSPFSFFNVFSSNPPIVIFSPARRVRDNTTKHTLQNVTINKEVVIGIVDENIIAQVSLSSCEFEEGISEFEKAGFTKANAECVKPFLINECLINLECKVNEIISLGNEGGAGNLVICEVLMMHVNDSILNTSGDMIDQTKLQHIARLGGDWYTKVNLASLFELPKPNKHVGMGIDQLPSFIKDSKILSNNDKAILANETYLPLLNPTFNDDKLKSIFQYNSLSPDILENEIHYYAAEMIKENRIEKAWQILLHDSNAL